MPDAGWWAQLLLVAAAAHTGLELVVHLVVYPALARSSGSDDGLAGHQDHMRRMSVAVAPVYGLLAVASAGLAVADPSPWSFAALGLVLATFAVTALGAVPAHEAVLRAEAVDRPRLHRRLARADLLRLVLSVLLLGVAWVLAR